MTPVIQHRGKIIMDTIKRPVITGSSRQKGGMNVENGIFKAVKLFCVILCWWVHGSICCCLVTKSCATLVTLWTIQPARLLCPQNSSGQNTGNGLLFPTPGDLPDPWIEPASCALAGRFFTTEPLGKPDITIATPNSSSFLFALYIFPFPHFRFCVYLALR